MPSRSLFPVALAQLRLGGDDPAVLRACVLSTRLLSLRGRGETGVVPDRLSQDGRTDEAEAASRSGAPRARSRDRRATCLPT
ncbi:hypothetical protein [Streptomyces phaeoluteigriseus]|uniref:hypothetical protein n=1 Tax=Streptomyces phaeoluteigriseus TaxID=114686 RepID=UPI0036CFFD95